MKSQSLPISLQSGSQLRRRSRWQVRRATVQRPTLTPCPRHSTCSLVIVLLNPQARIDVLTSDCPLPLPHQLSHCSLAWRPRQPPNQSRCPGLIPRGCSPSDSRVPSVRPAPSEHREQSNASLHAILRPQHKLGPANHLAFALATRTRFLLFEQPHISCLVLPLHSGSLFWIRPEGRLAKPSLSPGVRSLPSKPRQHLCHSLLYSGSLCLSVCSSTHPVQISVRDTAGLPDLSKHVPKRQRGAFTPDMEAAPERAFSTRTSQSVSGAPVMFQAHRGA